MTETTSQLEARSDPRPTAAAVAWPRKFNLFGVQVSATTYQEVVNATVSAARGEVPAIVSLHAAHALVTACDDPTLKQRVNNFQIVAPDGQPVRWALNWLYRTGLRDRVYGPELMLRLCARSAEEGIPIYLYGSSPEVIESLGQRLPEQFPGLLIAGAESPPFRALTAEEDAEMVQRINSSGAGIAFIGLGAPKQDHFAYEHRLKIRGVQVCVGAAFDFHAGTKKMAPAWMQRRGLEWLFRLLEEPGRLWKRYLVTNTLFLQKLCAQYVHNWFSSDRRTASTEAT